MLAPPRPSTDPASGKISPPMGKTAKIRDLSIAEIRDRYLADDASITPQLLEKLRRDRRRGVKAIYQQLARRLEAEREAAERLERMMDCERVLWTAGLRRVAGVDEAGMAPLAGPVVAAAVVFPPDPEAARIPGVDDSKRLAPEERERLEPLIEERATGIGVGVVEPEEIDRVNIYRAGLLAMGRAVEALPEPPEHLLVDARRIPRVGTPQNAFEKGDSRVYAVAAASIVAKCHRDRLMVEMDGAHPGYGFARHKGYPTAEHRRAIERLGPCPEHRRSFGVLDELTGACSDLFYQLQERLAAAETADDLRAYEAEWEECRETLSDTEQRKLLLVVRRRWKVVEIS